MVIAANVLIIGNIAIFFPNGFGWEVTEIGKDTLPKEDGTED